ncbi:MAG: DUF4340 domain-containing protein [Vicinamibacterales bacterium]
MRGLTSTLVLALVLAGLGAYIYFGEAPPAGDENRESLFTVEADQITGIRLTAGGETSVIEKDGDTWKMTAPVATDADATEVSGLTSNLASVAINRVVDEQASDLAAYGLADPRIRVAYTTAAGGAGTLEIGDKTPAGSDVYARAGDSNRVVLVSSFLETTFDKKPFDLRDKSVLAFERDKADGITIRHGSGEPIRLARDGSTWTVEAPVKARGDYGAIEGLLTRLSTASMSALVETDGTDLAKYGLADPAARITVSTGSSQATLALGPDVDGKTYARDEARELVFTVDPSLVTDLEKDVAAYRTKEVFGFRPFNAEQLTLVRNGTTVRLSKGGGDAGWQLERDGAKADVEQARVEDLLTKLSNIRAESFAETTDGSGLANPALTVAVSYDGGTFERVRLATDAGQGFAGREDEPGAARVPVAAVEDAVKAFEAVLEPPAPAPDAAKPPAGP